MLGCNILFLLCEPNFSVAKSPTSLERYIGFSRLPLHPQRNMGSLPQPTECTGISGQCYSTSSRLRGEWGDIGFQLHLTGRCDYLPAVTASRHLTRGATLLFPPPAPCSTGEKRPHSEAGEHLAGHCCLACELSILHPAKKCLQHSQCTAKDYYDRNYP